MDSKTSGIATTAFLLIIVSITDLPFLLKYPMLGITIISLILSLFKIYTQIKNSYSKDGTHKLNK
ncbi:MAG TPA: hypothetical protein VL088_09560 [Pedobacter sp.]|nr:hypothetical protein [Pedobacter sp.]